MDKIMTAYGIQLELEEVSKKHKKMKGIYIFYNTQNKKCYIGQSSDIYKRSRDHFCTCNRNCHGNKYIQRSWEKYGEENFKIYVIKIVEHSNELNDLELYYIQYFQSRVAEYGYNMRLDTHSRDKRNVNIGHDKQYPTLRKPIVQLDLYGNFIDRFEGIVIASKETGIPRYGIGKCCNKQRKSTRNGFIWIFEEEYNDVNFDLNKHISNSPKFSYNENGLYVKKVKKIKQIKQRACDYENRVYQMDLDGNIIKEWKYPAKAYSYGFDPNGIGECCNGNRKTHKGFMWKYKNKNEKG